MKRITVIFLCILLCVCIVGCTANTNIPEVSQQPESTLDSAIETADTSGESSANKNIPTPETSSTAEFDNPDTNADTSNVGTENNSKSENNTVSKEPDKTEDTKKPESPTVTEKKPDTSKPQETKPPAETAKPTEKPKPTEPNKPSESEPQKDPYAYPFNIEQIRRDCIHQGKGYGFTLNESLTPDNASWAGAETASSDTDGQFLKRLLYEMIEYYSPEYRSDMGLSELNITAFNIYFEPLGNNTYRIYFLFLL